MAESMFRRTTAATLGAVACALVAACTTTSSEPATPCADRGQKSVKLTIQMDENSLKPIAVVYDNGSDATEVHVCPGDYVRWKADRTEFDLQFDVEAPFDWSDRRKKGTLVGKDKPAKRQDQWQVIDVVRDGVTRGGDGLKYKVLTPAGELDPRIIVDH